MPNLLPFSLYVHIPYCLAKCPYCDFNSYGIRGESPEVGFEEQRYVEALTAELESYATQPAWSGRTVKTVFFGGGTPSLLSSESIEKILVAAKTRFPFQTDCEVTLEANPGTLQDEISFGRLKGYRSAGVNRISIGAQSFSASKLKLLGRLHSATETKDAVQLVRETGFTNFNLDLIFGVRAEGMPQWEFDLQSAIELAPRHISAYSLTLEPGTEFFKRSGRGEILTTDEDIQADMYQRTQQLLREHGYEQYEISNYAKPGYECQHNISYWDGTDYLGLGAGAHSFSRFEPPRDELYGMRWSNIPGPTHYMGKVLTKTSAQQRIEHLNREQAQLEFFSLGLRTNLGIRESRYQTLFNEGYSQTTQKNLRRFQNDGLVECTNEVARLTTKGFLFADGIIESLAC